MNFLKIKWVMLVTFIIMTIGLFGGAALADSTEVKTNDKQSGPIIIIIANGGNLSPAELKKELQIKLDEMIASGKITREQADKILQDTLIGRQPGQKLYRKFITSHKMDYQLITELKNVLQIKLNEIVASGRITREQADEILQNAFIDQQPGRKIIITEKMDNFYKEEQKDELRAKLNEMVANGKITQVQADEILQ